MQTTIGRAVVLAALAAGHACGPVAAQGADSAPVVAGRLGAELDEYFSRMAAFGFSGAVLVARGGEVVLRRGYGWADLERRIPVTPETAFEVASVTKQFTASAVLKLEEMGKLSLADSLGRFFPNVPADKRGITLHHLLTHTSGVHGPDEDPVRTREAWLEWVFSTPLAFAPGSRDEYSNEGFSLAAAVVEVAAGMPYERFVREHLLAPAGLAATGFRGEPSRWAPGQVALGYGVEGGGDPLAHPTRWGGRGAGGVVTTLGDLYRWELALRAGRVLSPASLAKLFTRQARTRAFFDYGYGWRVQRTRWGTPLYWASGFDLWGNAMFWRLPEEDAVVLFASNFGYDSFPFRDALVIPSHRGAVEPILTGRDYTLPPWFLPEPPRPLAEYAGAYRLPSGARIDVEAEGGALRLFPRSQAAGAALLPALLDSVPAAFDTMSARLARAVDALGRGGLAALPAAGEWVHKGITARAGTKETAAALGRLGRLEGVEWSVTLPVQVGNATTYTRLRFARGAADVRWYWENGRLYAIEPGFPLSVLPPFRPQSATEFVTYHIPLRRSLRVRFAPGADGRPAALLLPSPNGEVRAERVGGSR